MKGARRDILLGAALLLLFVSAQSALSQKRPQPPRHASAKPTPTPRQIPDGASPELERVEAAIAEAWVTIEDNALKSPSPEKLRDALIYGVLDSLDPYSHFEDKKGLERMADTFAAEYDGIGAKLTTRTLNGRAQVYVLSNQLNSPAAQAGLRFGDRIVEVDGWKAGGSVPQIAAKLKGPRGSMVRVTIERASDGAIETLAVKRSAVPRPWVTAYMLGPDIGFIDMTRTGFGFGLPEELAAALQASKDQGAKGLIIDLRGNGGGFSYAATQVAEQFLEAGLTIFSSKGRTIPASEIKSQNSAPERRPLVLLVDRSTASAAEIVAGALQDHDRALLVGESTVGKGLFQITFGTGNETAVTLAIARYYLPSGRLVQRDYSNGTYRYWDRSERGGPSITTERQKSFTDTGRVVYGGNGIEPDEVVKPRVTSQLQNRLDNASFAFVRELVSGRIPGLESYRLKEAADPGRQINPSEMALGAGVMEAFKVYLSTLGSRTAKLSLAADKEQEFITRSITRYLAIAKYGAIAGVQVAQLGDPQTLKAIEILPRAAALASAPRVRK